MERLYSTTLGSMYILTKLHSRNNVYKGMTSSLPDFPLPPQLRGWPHKRTLISWVFKATLSMLPSALFRYSSEPNRELFSATLGSMYISAKFYLQSNVYKGVTSPPSQWSSYQKGMTNSPPPNPKRGDPLRWLYSLSNNTHVTTSLTSA